MGRKAYTYEHPQGRSQIDYIFVRRQIADARARDCQPQTEKLSSRMAIGRAFDSASKDSLVLEALEG